MVEAGQPHVVAASRPSSRMCAIGLKMNVCMCSNVWLFAFVCLDFVLAMWFEMCTTFSIALLVLCFDSCMDFG